LRGELSAFEQRDGTELLLATGHERDFLADVSMLQGTSILGTLRVTSDEAETLFVPADKIRRALAEIPPVSTKIVNALIMRRRRLLRDRDFAVFRFVSIRDDRDGHLIDDFLDKNHIPHRVVYVKSEQGQELTKRFHLTSRDLPTLITPTGSSLRRPSYREIAQHAGLLRPLARADETEILSDLTIVGAGAAGVSPAVFAPVRGLETGVVGGSG